MKREEVKEVSEEMLARLIDYINNASDNDEDCDHLKLELAATLCTNVICSYATEKEALDVYMKEMDWLAFSVGNAAKNFYQGCQEYRIIGEDI